MPTLFFSLRSSGTFTPPAPLQYRANLTECDVANRCHERRWVLNPYFSIPVALGLVCLFAWDWVRGLVGRVL